MFLLGRLYVSRNLFLLGCPICCHVIDLNSLLSFVLYFWVFSCNIFLCLILWIHSFFVVVGRSSWRFVILFIFLKMNIDLFHCLFNLYFIYVLTLVISFFLLILGFICSSFLVPWGAELICLRLLTSWDRLLLLWVLRLLLLIP